MILKKQIDGRINRIAETHNSLRPQLENALKNSNINEEGQQYMAGAKTYYEFWKLSASDHFFDMATLIRLGTEIEIILKLFYMNKKSVPNMYELEKITPKGFSFQRITGSKPEVIKFFIKELNIDLEKNPKFKVIQEIMILRHLYTHNSGILNEKFLIEYRNHTGIDILSCQIAHAYPNHDVYYFDPLLKIGQFIEDLRVFVIYLLKN